MNEEERFEEKVEETLAIASKEAVLQDERTAIQDGKPRRRRGKARRSAPRDQNFIKSKEIPFDKTGSITYISINPEVADSRVREGPPRPLIVVVGNNRDGGGFPKVPGGWVQIRTLAYSEVMDNSGSPMYIRQSTYETIVRDSPKRMNAGIASGRNKSTRSKVAPVKIPFSKTVYEAISKVVTLSVAPAPSKESGVIKGSKVSSITFVEGTGQDESIQALGSYAVAVSKKAKNYNDLVRFEQAWRRGQDSSIWPDAKYDSAMAGNKTFCLVDPTRARETNSERPIIVESVERALVTGQVPLTYEDLPDRKERFIVVPTEQWGYRLSNLLSALSIPAIISNVERIPTNLQRPSIQKFCSNLPMYGQQGLSGVETITRLDQFAIKSNKYIIKAGEITGNVTLSFMTEELEQQTGIKLMNTIKTRVSRPDAHEAELIQAANFALVSGLIVDSDFVIVRSPDWAEGGVHVARSPGITAVKQAIQGNIDIMLGVVIPTGGGKTFLTYLLEEKFEDIGSVIVETEQCWYPHLAAIDKVCKAHLSLPKEEGNGNVMAALNYGFSGMVNDVLTSDLTILDLLSEFMAERWKGLLVPSDDGISKRRTIIALTPLFYAAMGRCSTVVEVKSLEIEQDYDNRENELPASFRRILRIAYDNDLLGAVSQSSHQVVSMKGLIEALLLSDRFVAKE